MSNNVAVATVNEGAVVVVNHTDLVAQINALSDGASGVFALPAEGIEGGDVIVISNRHVTLISAEPSNRATYLQSTPYQRHFILDGENSSLTLKNVILNGGWDGEETGIGRGGVRVENGALLVLEEGSKITGCYWNLDWSIQRPLHEREGGGVFMDGGRDSGEEKSRLIMHEGSEISGNIARGMGGGVYSLRHGSVEMHGSIISNNTAGNTGGIALEYRSTLVMNGGTIHSNSTEYGGAVHVGTYATFEMHGGTINNNVTEDQGHGGYGGGVYLCWGSTFTMYDGEITENTASWEGGGIYMLFGRFTMYGGTISGNVAGERGGGITTWALDTLTIHGGTISHNEAQYGGGVYKRVSRFPDERLAGLFTMTGGEITNNRAERGGGVFLSKNAEMNMQGGTIANNTAERELTALHGSLNAPLEAEIGFGGGIYATGEASLTMHDGLITNNKACEDGGGVRITSSSLFTMNNGTIDGNIAGGDGGGIWLGAGHCEEGSGAAWQHGRATIYAGSITNNIAGGDGGGIFTQKHRYEPRLDATDYDNLEIHEPVLFEGNSACRSSIPPLNSEVLKHINFARSSISKNDGFYHILNNYDINYYIPSHRVTYVGYYPDGGSHVVRVSDREKAPELVPKNRDGHDFIGWDTEDNERWNFDTPITQDLYLYAKFVSRPTVTPSPATGGGGSSPGGGSPSPSPSPEPSPNPNLMIPMSRWHQAYLVGFEDGTIRPSDNITRAEAATIFFRLIEDEFRVSVWAQTNNFPDVDSSDWFNNAVSTMVNVGIIRGDDWGFYNPRAPITRGEFAAMISRFTDIISEESYAFNDIDGHWAANYINLAYFLGWVQGDDWGDFRPNSHITRAEATAVVDRMMSRVLRSREDLLPNMKSWPDNVNENAWYYLHIQHATNAADFERIDNTHIRWTQLWPHFDFTILERPNACATDIFPVRTLWMQQKLAR
jgi:hypothetical protein